MQTKKTSCTAATAQDKKEANKLQDDYTPDFEKSKASYVLSDEIMEISLQLRYASVVLNDLYDDYLSQSVPAEMLLMYQDDAMARSEIILGYLHEARENLKHLENLCDKYLKTKRQEEPSC